MTISFVVTSLGWEKVKSGFNSCEWESNTILHNLSDLETQDCIQMRVIEFSSEEQDCFGASIPKYALALNYVTRSTFEDGIDEISSIYFLGEFYASESAMKYAVYVEKSWQQDFLSCLPICTETFPFQTSW